MNWANLQDANLRHTALRGLDLRGFDLRGLDLRNANLSATDLRDARLDGTYLRDADLSSATLHGPELFRAKLYSNEFLGNRSRDVDPGKAKQESIDGGGSPLMLESSSQTQIRVMQETRQPLSDREAYTLGEQVVVLVSDPVDIHRLFPEGFDFTIVRQVFDAWLVPLGDSYSEQEIDAIWIGFAHQICDLYFEDEPGG